MSALPPSTTDDGAADASTAGADPAAALLSFSAPASAPSSSSAASASANSDSKPAPSGQLRVWQVEVIRMWIGCRIEGINVGTNLFLSRSAALDFAYAQALILEEIDAESRDPDFVPVQPFERAADGNYHWDDGSYPGWGHTIKTAESTINFDAAAQGAAIFSSFYSAD